MLCVLPLISYQLTILSGKLELRQFPCFLRSKFQIFTISRLRACLHCVQNYKIFYACTWKVSTQYKNGAYERNGLTASSVGGHNSVLNWMTEIADLLQVFVVSVKFGSDYAPREVVLSV